MPRASRTLKTSDSSSASSGCHPPATCWRFAPRFSPVSRSPPAPGYFLKTCSLRTTAARLQSTLQQNAGQSPAGDPGLIDISDPAGALIDSRAALDDAHGYSAVNAATTPATSTGLRALVASPTASSTRCVPGSAVGTALGQVQIPRSVASVLAAAANRSWVVSSSRCIIGVCGGSGITRTSWTSRSAAAIALAWSRYCGILGSRVARQVCAEAAPARRPVALRRKVVPRRLLAADVPLW